MPAININSDALKGYTERLEQHRRSSLPLAVRQTLNSAALDVKRVTMIHESDRNFKKRKPSFFRATSRAQLAKGFDIGSMQSIVGFVAPGNTKESGHATRDLEQQEEGGDIDKRAFIATSQARTGADNVKDAYRMAAIKNDIWNSGNPNVVGSDKEKFIISALYAKAYGGYVLGNQKFKNGNKHLYKILSIIKVGGQTHVNTELIYNVKRGRKAHVKSTHFMRNASDETAGKMNDFFVKHATVILNKKK